MWLWWLGVLVAGCSQGGRPGPTPQTQVPTLWSLTLPITTATPLPRLLRTPTLWATTSIMPVTRAVTTPLPMLLATPNCYETPVGSLWCLGLIRNEQTFPVEQVVIRVYLVKGDGTAIAAKEAAAARVMLPPQTDSPYGVLFEAVPDGVGPVAVIVSATQRLDWTEGTLPVQVRDVESSGREDGYHVTGTLVNTTNTALQQLSVIVTLFDGQGRVTGYRQSRLPPNQSLAPGGKVPFAVDVIPQGLGTVRTDASAEGRSG
jgi:hypothetical protein